MLGRGKMSQRGEIVGLQFLRGFCAIAVVLYHAAGMVALPKYFGAPILGDHLDAGQFGVDIFFVISGFIIALVALDAGTLRSSLSAATFLKRRFARIVPIMWVAILSYAGLQLVFARADIDAGGYLRALFLVPEGHVRPDMIWTLRHEALFYLLFCASFFGRRWRLVWIGAWFLAPVVYAFARGDPGATVAGIDSPLSILCSPVNLEFAAGLLLGIIWMRRGGESRLELPVHPFVVILLLTAIALVVAWYLPPDTQSLPLILFLAPVGAALVWLSAAARCPPGSLTSIGRLLGDASYSIYLFHLHVLASLLAIWARLAPSTPPGLVVALAAIAATCGGIIAHLVVEKPLVRFVQTRLSPRAEESGR